jgi:hypothetical protein
MDNLRLSVTGEHNAIMPMGFRGQLSQDAVAVERSKRLNCSCGNRGAGGEGGGVDLGKQGLAGRAAVGGGIDLGKQE